MNTISQIEKTTIRNKVISFLFTMLLISFFGSQNTSAGISDFKLATSAPKALDATNVTNTSFTANWNEVKSATSYKLFVELNFSGTWIALDGYQNGKTVTGTSYNLSSILHSSEYRYRVKAATPDGESGFSNAIHVHTKHNPPTTKPATKITTNSFTANWDAVTGINTYLLTVSRDSDQHVIINNLEVNGTSHNVTGLSPGHAYRYAVKAKTDNNVSDNSNWTQVSTKLETPVTNAATNITSASFKFSWDAVAGASSYKIFVLEKQGGVPLPNYFDLPIAETSITLQNLKPETEYIYVVQAFSASSSSGMSSDRSATTLSLTPPTILPVSNVTSNSFQINWTLPEGATGALLAVWETNSNAFVIGDANGPMPVTGNSYTVTGLESNTTYSYRLKSTHGDIVSTAYSQTEQVTTVSAPVALPATNITSTSFKANWETFTAAVHYELYVLSRRSTISNWRVVEGYNGIEVHGLEKIVTGLASNREYKYFIRARYKNKDESDPSNEILVTTDDTGTSVNSITEANISIYPNPAQNHISIEGVETNSTIDIFSITGAKMMRLDNQSGKAYLDVSGFDNGMYIIKISSQKGSVSRKVFISR